MTAGTRLVSFTAFLHFIALFLIHGARAKEIVVGGEMGWTNLDLRTLKSPNYQTWASSHKVVEGDLVVFKFVAGQHNVNEMSSKEAYLACDFSKAKELDGGSSGTYIWRARKVGIHYFGCGKEVEGEGTHCSNGQRVAVEVVESEKEEAVDEAQLTLLSMPHSNPSSLLTLATLISPATAPSSSSSPPSSSSAPPPAASSPLANHPPSSSPPPTSPSKAPSIPPSTTPLSSPSTPPKIAPISPPASSPSTPPFIPPVTSPTTPPVTSPTTPPVTPPSSPPVLPPTVTQTLPPTLPPTIPPVSTPPPAKAPSPSKHKHKKKTSHTLSPTPTLAPASLAGPPAPPNEPVSSPSLGPTGSEPSPSPTSPNASMKTNLGVWSYITTIALILVALTH